MRNCYSLVHLLVTFVAAITLSAPTYGRLKPAILVYPGGQLRPAVFAGTIFGLRKQGYDPRYIITSCGGSLGASLYATLGSIEELRNYLQSIEFYKQMQAFSGNPERAGFSGFSIPLFELFSSPLSIPDIYNKTLFRLDYTNPALQKNPLAHQQFPAEAERRLIIVSSEVLFNPSQVGAPVQTQDPLFREAYFTDSYTAEFLANLTSIVAQENPQSHIAPDTKVQTSSSLLAASLASMAEPTVLEPVIIENRTYISGAVNLYPYELARQLKSHPQFKDWDIIMPLKPKQDFMVQNIFKRVFGIDQNARVQKYNSIGNVLRFDHREEDNFEYGFDPKLEVSLNLGIYSGVPPSLETFRQYIQHQWDWGVQHSRLIGPRH